MYSLGKCSTIGFTNFAIKYFPFGIWSLFEEIKWIRSSTPMYVCGTDIEFKKTSKTKKMFWRKNKIFCENVPSVQIYYIHEADGDIPWNIEYIFVYMETLRNHWKCHKTINEARYVDQKFTTVKSLVWYNMVI